MAFAKACEGARGEDVYFNGHFAKFLGPRFRTAGGQGGSRKHCAIPFRPAAKRQLENCFLFPKKVVLPELLALQY